MNQTVSLLIWLVMMAAMFYFILYLPENKRKKRFKTMLESLKVNDEIVTRGGIIGKIVNIQSEFLIIQTGPDKVKVKISKQGISNVFEKKSDTSK